MVLLLLIPYTLSFALHVSPNALYSLFAFLNVFTYISTFLNPVMFFVVNPDFKQDLWHLIKCHYIKKEEKVFSFKHPSESFSEESDSPPRSPAQPQPFDNCNELVYPSTPSLTRAEVYSMSLENNSEVARVKASIVLSAGSMLAPPLSSGLIYENTDAQSAGSFDQGRENLSGLSCIVVFSREGGRDEEKVVSRYQYRKWFEPARISFLIIHMTPVIHLCWER